MRIRINNGLYVNKYFQVDEGATYTMNYNETLDSASIRISHLTEELDIEPFDEIILETDAFTRYMCVDSYSTIQEGLDTPTYVYNITLVSQTKLLENIILPNISITPRKIGKKLSIADYLQQYLNEYASYKNWRFKDNFETIFGDDCPELQWNMPTLREVFNTLMMVKDKIPVLENGIIGWLDLTERKGEVSGDINYIQKSQSADNYVSEIRMQMQNVLQTNVKDVKNTCNTYENLTFTTNDYVATSDNIFLKTKFPILNIKHLWLTCYYNNTEQKVVSFKVDLCNLDGDNIPIVYESKEYNILPVLYRTLNIETSANFDNKTVKDYFSKYKNYCIYYTRGDNKILGFTNVQKGAVLQFTNQTFEWIKALAFSRVVKDSDDYTYNSINNGYSGYTANGFFNAFFQIEYETSVASVFSASKEIKVRNQRVVIDNQTNSWVEASSQGFLEYQKANRMGNQQLLINQRSKYPQNIETLISIGKTYRDSVVYQTQYQIYKHHIEVNAYATKNYILQNYFTGIKSKIRTWVNAQNEAFVRNELIKRYCVFSLENKNISDFDSSYFLSPFNSQSDKIIKYAVIRTSETASADRYLFDVVSRAIGKSIIFTTGFDDNWIIGKHVNVGTHEQGVEAYKDGIVARSDIQKGYYAVTTKQTFCPSIEGMSVLSSLNPSVNSSFGGIPFNHYKYVDDNGEYTSVSIQLINSYSALPLPALNTYDYLIYRSYARPLLLINELFTSKISELDIELHKDNKEIPIFNLQYEFISDNENIVVTEYFARYQEAVRTKVPQFNYYYNTTFNRSARNMSDFENFKKTTGSISVSNNKVTIEAERPQDTILYVCDEEQNIILMLNTNETSIYLNVSDRRI